MIGRLRDRALRVSMVVGRIYRGPMSKVFWLVFNDIS